MLLKIVNNRVNIIFVIFLSLTLITGCGKKKTKKKVRKPISVKTSIVKEEGKNTSDDLMKNRNFIKNQFPGFKENTNSEQDFFILFKAEQIVYLKNGGKMKDWLKKKHLVREDWAFLESYYSMDPTVRKKVYMRVQDLMTKR